MCEARNASGTVTAQYFVWGQTISGSSYFYTKDHLGSVHELTNSSGTIQAQYSYNAYGRDMLLQGSNLSDFQFGGYYTHQPSGLSLTTARAYNCSWGQWLSRDPVSETIRLVPPMNFGIIDPITTAKVLGIGKAEILAGPNLYAYVRNNPLLYTDRSGLDCDCTQAPPMSSSSSSCGDYGSTTYLGASQQCFCRCAGDSTWAQQVRGCLSCEYHKGTPTSEAHQRCYGAAGWGGAPWATLGGCEVQCQQSWMAY